jgi:aryl-alcohol dehydrogenase-like predicted oxidoreductase
MAFAPPPPPTSALGYYRLLSPKSSVRVSPLCLGGMNFGESWQVANKNLMCIQNAMLTISRKEVVGPCDHKAMLDLFYDHGGNFIDTCVTWHNQMFSG